MTSFEFVFGLISIVTSLAATHLIGGLIAAVRHRARFSLRHALWSWTAFALVIANWASFWADRTVDWEPVAVLRWLALMISLYAFSALTVPEIERGDKVDLVAFHESDGKRYITAHVLFAVIVIAGFAINVTTFADWLGDANFALVGLALTVAALVVRPVLLQQAIALALAAFGTFFMLTRLSILAG